MATSTEAIITKISDVLGELRGSLYTAINDGVDDLLQSSIERIYAIDPDELDRPWSEKRGDWVESQISPLELAISFNNSKAVELLFKKTELSLTRECGFPLIHRAAAKGNPEILNVLMQNSGNPHAYYYASVLHEAMDSLGAASKSLVYEVDWGDLTAQIESWWLGKTPDWKPTKTPRITWDGPLAAMKFLLEAGANPTLKDENGISCLQIAQDPTSPNHTKLFSWGGKLLRCEKGVPILEIDLISKDAGSRFPIIVEYHRNKQKALLEQYVEKNKLNGHREKEAFKTWLRIKTAQEEADKKLEAANKAMAKLAAMTSAADERSQKAHASVAKVAQSVTNVAQSVRAVKAAIANTSDDVKDLKDGAEQLYDQHVTAYQEQQKLKQQTAKALTVAKKAEGIALENKDKTDKMWKTHYSAQEKKERLDAIKRDKSTPSYAFYRATRVELYRLLESCILLLSDPKKNSKCKNIATVIQAIADHAPAPFCGVGKALAYLVKKYGERKERAEHNRVGDLIPENYREMCIDLALTLTEHFENSLIQIPADKAKKHGLEAVGIMLALMCDEKSSLSPLDSDEAIQEQLFVAVMGSKVLQEHFKSSIVATPVPKPAVPDPKPAAKAAPKPVPNPSAKPATPVLYSPTAKAIGMGDIARAAAATVLSPRCGVTTAAGLSVSVRARVQAV